MTGVDGILLRKERSNDRINLQEMSAPKTNAKNHTRSSVSGSGPRNTGTLPSRPSTRGHVTTDGAEAIDGKGANNVNNKISSHHTRFTNSKSLTNASAALGSTQKSHNKHHYRHKNSRATPKLPPTPGNGLDKVKGAEEFTRGHTIADAPNGDNNISRTRDSTNDIGVHHQVARKQRRTVSLPKAGSRLVNHHYPYLNNAADTNTRSNNNTASATTDNSTREDVHNGNNNHFPPIGGGNVTVCNVDSGDGAEDFRNIGGKGAGGLGPSSRGLTSRGGQPRSPEVPLSRLHFLTEQTFDSVHAGTPPIHTNNNGSGGVGLVLPKTPTGVNHQKISIPSPDLLQSNQQPLSTPTSSSEKARVKFEKKIQLTSLTERSGTTQPWPSPRANNNNNKVSSAFPMPNGTTNNIGTSDKNRTDLVSKTDNNNNTRLDNNNTVNGANNNPTKPRWEQRDSITSKSGLKVAPPEEPFSIRRKIEQFRKWHEEHYMDKLKRFDTDLTSAYGNKTSINEGHRGDPVGNSQNTNGIGLVDYAKVLERRISTGENNQNSSSVKPDGGNGTTGGAVILEKPGMGGRLPTHVQHFGRGPEPFNKQSSSMTFPKFTNNVTYANATCIDIDLEKPRPVSAVTWKTWRDVNTSDAYKDVKKYIRDNDLMDDEREAWIKSWIKDVADAMLDTKE